MDEGPGGAASIVQTGCEMTMEAAAVDIGEGGEIIADLPDVRPVSDAETASEPAGNAEVFRVDGIDVEEAEDAELEATRGAVDNYQCR